MRTYRFWAEAVEDLEVDGALQRTRVCAGSNHSEADAREEAQRRLAWVRLRIAGEASPRREAEYEADIREPVLEALSEEAVITRNRYGAQVLNCARLPILDVDHPPARIRDWFSRKTPEWAEARMRSVLGDLLRKPWASPLGFRLYATAQGFRVIVLGQEALPSEPLLPRLVRALHVDPLYWTLCRKQACYRARLTPKPHRIQVPRLRLPFPLPEDRRADLDAWLETYETRSHRFATCRFLAAFGPDPAHPLVALHDQRTGAHSTRTLA
ncbi:MAG: hypothetical protein BWY56_00921 [Acidobacteria bacterium ADurb.Bin340]|nr:MAG: hypothetical protein BWY56_00921 [Acidobacteria bacterium ADurb.Bin340]